MIRPLELNDLDIVNDLINDCNYIINEYELEKNSYVYLIDNKIVAFISYVIFFERAELNYIFVSPDYRGIHIASDLMEHMLNECKQKQVLTVDLEVNSTNVHAINLYKKYDFEIINIRKKYYEGNDGYLMIKEIR